MAEPGEKHEHDPHDPRGGRTNPTGPQGAAEQAGWQESRLGEKAVREANMKAAGEPSEDQTEE